MDEILLPNEKTVNDPLGLSQQASVLPRRSGLSLAVGKSSSSSDKSAWASLNLTKLACTATVPDTGAGTGTGYGILKKFK
ncbi:hypothetical protein L195_g036566, partial [Trifolium pratense]